jgi:hypothetical protein
VFLNKKKYYISNRLKSSGQWKCEKSLPLSIFNKRKLKNCNFRKKSSHILYGLYLVNLHLFVQLMKIIKFLKWTYYINNTLKYMGKYCNFFHVTCFLFVFFVFLFVLYFFFFFFFLGFTCFFSKIVFLLLFFLCFFSKLFLSIFFNMELVENSKFSSVFFFFKTLWITTIFSYVVFFYEFFFKWSLSILLRSFFL